MAGSARGGRLRGPHRRAITRPPVRLESGARGRAAGGRGGGQKSAAWPLPLTTDPLIWRFFLLWDGFSMVWAWGGKAVQRSILRSKPSAQHGCGPARFNEHFSRAAGTCDRLAKQQGNNGNSGNTPRKALAYLPFGLRQLFPADLPKMGTAGTAHRPARPRKARETARQCGPRNALPQRGGGR